MNRTIKRISDFQSLGAILFSLLVTIPLSALAADKEKHILIVAGSITGHGKNTHEYEKSAILIKHLLDRSALDDIKTTVVFDGWPSDPKVLDTADTIVLISDGGDHKESNHPLYNGDRLAHLEQQMNRGCGLVQLHWSTFNPSRFHDKITRWVGGYFDYEKGTAANKWYSAIKHYTEPVRLGEPEHPISNGVKPFRVLEEFYYRIRFRENDERLRKIVLSRPPGEKQEYAVGWAVQRKDGGRGFGFTGGHYYMNWWEPNFRKLVLNAIVWSAGVNVPQKGVETRLDEPSRALIVTGYNHPAHKWRETTAAIIQVVENDPRILVDVTEDPEFLGSDKLSGYDVVLMNYSSWDRKGLSDKAKKGFVKYLQTGGGLSVIHFANGSWTDTLPNKKSDWPEYRTRIVRRVWVHGDGQSGHDAFGDFRVTRTKRSHPITDGLKDFNTRDELYYRQQGPLPIEPLVTAVSRDTKKSEPMAWAYPYEKGKVFQTVLGHADVSILMAADVIRRGTIWAAGLDNLSFDPPIERKLPYMWRSGAQWSPKTSAAKAKQIPGEKVKPQLASMPTLVKGRFGQALNARKGGVLGKAFKQIQEPNLTVECWVKIDSKKSFNIIAASETKSSMRHWELYTYQGTGVLSLYMPGIFGEIKSGTDVCDGKWHYVAMTLEKQFVRLYVDGKKVKEQPINYRKHPETKEGFAIGSLVEKTILCDGVIDEVRLSAEIKTIDSIPEGPFQLEAKTIGLWRFDQLNKEKQIKDQSRTKNDMATVWQGIAAKKVTSSQTEKPKKITGHWGEDAIGFRWTEKDSEDNRWAFTKHGRFLASTIPLPGGFAEKGLVVKVGEDEEASVCYDLKRMNLMAGWSGGFLEFHQARFGLIRHLRPAGKMLFYNQPGLGWNSSNLRYHGLYSHGERVVIEYSVDGTRFHESPWLLKSMDMSAISRTLRIGKSSKKLLVPLSSGAKAKGKIEIHKRAAAIEYGQELVAAFLLGDPDDSTSILVRDNQIWLSVEASDKVRDTQVLLWRGKKQNLPSFLKLAGEAQPDDLDELTKPGPSKWNEAITTRGVVGEQPGMGYAVDTIRLPFKNPYGSLFFVTGHDWLDNGDMVVATVHGEVWLAKNIDHSLREVTWKRFATGLYQPLGIRVVNNQVYVLCRDQIVRLHDRDGDEEIDHYECFHADVTTSTGVHDYVCCLETDKDGNFYYIHANDGVVRVTADGKKRKIVATGFRNPNGMGVRSDGLVTAAPQEGEWTPASAVCEVVEGLHYGYRGPKPKTKPSPLGYEKPLVFLPRLVDNSSGGQFWTESDRWGVFQNQLFHLSYGKCTMMMVLRDQLPPTSDTDLPVVQGAVVPFPQVFESGVCRGRMSPHDGQLYVSGLKGWTTAAVRDGSIQRVRFLAAEKSVNSFCPIGYKVFANGIELEFSQPIKPETVASNTFQLQAWNYLYSKNYGSPEFKISNPNQQGRDQWTVRSAKLTNGNRKVFLEIPAIQVADQVAIKINVGSDSAKFDNTIYATIKQKREQVISPAKPFNKALAVFEEKLTPGLVVRPTGWRKSSMTYFANQPVVRDLSLEGWLKIESPATVLELNTGPDTVGLVQLKTLNQDAQFLNSSEWKIASSSTVSVPINIDYGYCQLKIELKSPKDQIQFQGFWRSRDFGREPIPAEALFADQSMTRLRTDHSDTNKNKRLAVHAGNLIEQKNCTRCHDFGQSNHRKEIRWQTTSPDLKELASRRSPEYVFRKILEPHFEGNSGAMPALLNKQDLDDQRRARELVAFLMEDGLAVPEKTPLNASKVELGERLYEELGCIGCHHLPFEDNEDRYQRISLKFTAQKFTPSGLRQFLADPHRHAPFRKMGNFHLTKEETESLSQFISKHSTQPIQPQKTKSAKVDSSRGKEHFVKLGCANCHESGNEQIKPTMFASKNLRVGCLDDRSERSSSRASPDLGLAAGEKQVLRAVLAKVAKNGEVAGWSLDNILTSTPVWRNSLTAMNQLRCATCHTTETAQASLPEIILEEGVLGFNPERLPNLTHIGEKLKADWLKDFLGSKSQMKIRPWLKARMPYFGGYSHLLAHGLSEQSGFNSQVSEKVAKLNPLEAKTGFRLTTQNGGLDCRQCHGVGELPPRGDEKTQIVLGVNFSLVNDRIRKGYYDRWMRDPLRIDPQTKMPRYSPDGRYTKIKEIHDGDAKRQFDAIWHYLNSLR